MCKETFNNDKLEEYEYKVYNDIIYLIINIILILYNNLIIKSSYTSFFIPV